MRSDVERMVEFIRAQIDEEERLARAAVITAHEGPNAYQPHPELAAWRYVPDGEVEYVSTPEMVAHEHHEPYRVTCDSEGILPAVDERVGPHIARQDPASTLARVAAHRAILDHFENHRKLHHYHPEHVAYMDGLEYAVRRIGSMYAGRDGFDESWRPA